MRTSLLAFAVVALLQVGCSGAGSSGPDDLGAASDTDAGRDGPALTDTRGDAGGERDIRFHDPDGREGRKFGAACNDNSECESGWCIPYDEGFVCTELCLETCPDGWDCRGVPQVAPDILFLCYPQNSHLCQPCASDYECEGGYCLPVEGTDKTYCTRPCNEELGCPEGFSCQEEVSLETGVARNMCVPRSGRCDCTAANEGQARACSFQNELGTCWGVETCDAAAGWTGCSASVPMAEDCNAIDDDCNGLPDDLPVPPAEPCQRTISGVGTCPGQWFCRGVDGWFCSAPEPKLETCDYQDNDCDGQTDEDFVDAAGRYVDVANCGGCGVSCVDRILHGQSVCRVSAEGEPYCDVESCDPGWYQIGAICVPATSSLCLPCVSDASCIVPGDRCVPVGDRYFCGRDCAPGSAWGEQCPEGFACEAVFPGQPDVRQCVPLSDSCDCTADNAGAQRSCTATNAYGTCFGLQLCEAAGGWSACSAAVPAPEDCDGIDNDCDGFVDEQVQPPREACRTEYTDPTTGETAACDGTWACRREGEVTGWACLAIEAGPDVCDYIDNDCDGQTDEGARDPLTGQYVSPDHCGLCDYSCAGSISNATEVTCSAESGVPRCVVVACEDGYYAPEGVETACVQVGAVADCTPCGNDAQCAALEAGRCIPFDSGRFCLRACPTGTECPEGYGCTDGVCFPQTRSCTCRSELQVGLTRSCFRENAAGACVGTQTCQLGTGWSPCSARTPTAEICDGIDNNCNGIVDGQVPGAGDVCQNSNAFGICAGVRICGTPPGGTGISLFCSAQTPMAEVCNYLDDDCDGAIDETFRSGASGDGLYVHPQHCGACNASCAGRIPNATATCSGASGVARCVVAECAPGFYPVSDQSCAPVGDDICRPCEDDGDCPVPGDLCVALADGGFCGRNCAAGNLHGTPAGQCPAGYACQAVGAARQCLPVSGSCGCLPGDEGKTRVCVNENPFGTCYGTERCDPTRGWQLCTARTPAAEICNGEDDDCNGRADDAALLGQGCFREALIDGQTFLCTGAYVCTAGSPDPQCSARTPTAERCNYVDDDCDGQTDETFPTLYETCSVGTGACRRFGYVQCTADGSGTRCTATAGPAEAEVCNGVDDDCNGQTDERWTDVGSICTVGLGICERYGIRQCNPAAPAGPTICAATPRAAAVEVCNGVDDDCDGLTDEDWPQVGTVCEVGLGACERAGVWKCSTVDPTQAVCSAQPGTPAPVERCDGVDDDCDGLTDETWPEKGSVCVVGRGICERAGVYRCDPANPMRTTCSMPPGPAAPRESCNGLDDDCDGLTDEDWPTLGRTCTAGYGLCLRAGVYVCNAASPDDDQALCNAVAGEAAPLELCDYQDDDCDGQTDEGYLDDWGRYANVDHCGACGNSCNAYWVPHPQAYNIAPYCNVSGPSPACDYICITGTVDADGIPENGCELTIDPGAVYVATRRNGGADNGTCGNYHSPCETIAYAMDRAQTLRRPRVLVSDGLYTEQVVLRPGISVLGGYNHLNWQRDWTVNVTLVQGNPFMPGLHKYTVVAAGITQAAAGNVPTRFEGFTVQGLLNPLAGGNSYAIYVRDCDGNLAIANNTIYGANGGVGLAGVDGLSGAEGADGGNGRAAGSAPRTNCGAPVFTGGAGGAAICANPGGFGATTDVSGGAGGGVTCPQLGLQAQDGFDGRGPASGVGGDGGWDSQTYSSGCYVSSASTFHMPGYDGLRGARGSDGVGGAGASDPDGSVVGGEWVGATGLPGTHGQHGSGGGGGGGGAGSDTRNVSNDGLDDFGATGGGGGAGGCAAWSGYGGNPGGGSFGIFIAYVSLTPTTPAHLPIIEGNSFWRGIGGRGGYGGNGGSGGDGGQSGLAGGIGAVAHYVFCVAVGGQGGSGGRGGHGGGAGGGAGGVSFDIYGWGFRTLVPNFRAVNEFFLEETYWTGGAGGNGGNSPNTTTGTGSAGANGASGQVKIEPGP
jgi:hypothetical protein